MEKSKILSADLLDILFEGRNKNYGAYELRKTYSRRINYALTGTVCVCLLFVVGSLLANRKQEQKEMVGPVITLENFKEKPKTETPPPVVKPEPRPVEMARVTPPLIVPDKDVTPPDEVKDISTLEDVKIGTIDTKGDLTDVVMPPVEKSTGKTEAPHTDDETDKIFVTVQNPAEFNGGPEAWRKYLTRNLNSDLPSQNGAPAAAYTVVVSFIVDREGAISDVKAENDPGYGTKAEAIRVIQKGPNWKPAIQNGRKVIYRHRQSITFMVKDE